MISNHPLSSYRTYTIRSTESFCLFQSTLTKDRSDVHVQIETMSINDNIHNVTEATNHHFWLENGSFTNRNWLTTKTTIPCIFILSQEIHLREDPVAATRKTPN